MQPLYESLQEECSNVFSRQSTINFQTYNQVLVIGVGGIGSWVALNLGLSGLVNGLVLCDPDKIEETNLNRTPFRICDIGSPKVFAMKELIWERRPKQRIACINFKFNMDEFLKFGDTDIGWMTPDLVIDCRDDVFDDVKKFTCPVWKLGHDGLELTIDTNSKDTKVWGVSQGYEVTPSFLCPAQLAANLVVNYIFMDKKQIDFFGDDPLFSKRVDGIVTFDSGTLLADVFRIQSMKEKYANEWSE